MMIVATESGLVCMFKSTNDLRKVAGDLRQMMEDIDAGHFNPDPPYLYAIHSPRIPKDEVDALLRMLKGEQ